MSTTDRSYEALSAVRTALPLLGAALVPGTPRRWSQRDLTDEQRARLDQLARAEREAKHANLARGIKVLGTGPAPLRLDVLDVQADIAAGVTELEDAVTEKLELTLLAGASTAERISRIIGLLDRIAVHEDLADHVHAEAVRLRRLAARALGEDEQVVRLNARCHVCDARSLRAFPEREVVACLNNACRCDDKECPCHDDPPRRHRWAFSEWPWLAQVIAEEIGVQPINALADYGTLSGRA
ncbi:hypothetical protein IMZ11_33820 [Microtetraspora sp. AC03309]|uniref:hypothetical protein n=1 Tax=Microtetraspora sp. AC03309 TaxID=2779376 RepID=UPI001E3E8365|nr:hypothetical protein [Microtetraspora sp. AC03309]MCC5580608.1 hypothetical protein [Microtetraspora sp. AC03309]